jgi:hypothetical protein
MGLVTKHTLQSVQWTEVKKEMEAKTKTTNETFAGVTIRRLGQADFAAVRNLAELDSAPDLTGELLGAEVEGHLLAAISLADGSTVADPFSHSGELRDLLELRAAQLRYREGTRVRFRKARKRSRAALAGSPPGAGGRLISLPIRPY